MKSTLLLILPVLLLLCGCGSGSSDSDSLRLRYAGIGASDAVGIGASPLTQGYVFLIEEGLVDDGHDTELFVLGIPGGETDDIVDFALPAARQINPDLATVFVGANDLIGGVSVENFESDLSRLLRELREDTSAFVVIANLPDLTSIPRFVMTPDEDVTLERVIAFNDVIARQAAANDAPVVDLFSEALSDALFNEEDGFHPSNEGHQFIADRFLEVIRQNFNP